MNGGTSALLCASAALVLGCGPVTQTGGADDPSDRPLQLTGNFYTDYERIEDQPHKGGGPDWPVVLIDGQPVEAMPWNRLIHSPWRFQFCGLEAELQGDARSPTMVLTRENLADCEFAMRSEAALRDYRSLRSLLESRPQIRASDDSTLVIRNAGGRQAVLKKQYWIE